MILTATQQDHGVNFRGRWTGMPAASNITVRRRRTDRVVHRDIPFGTAATARDPNEDRRLPPGLLAPAPAGLRRSERDDESSTDLALTQPGRSFYCITPPDIAPAAVRARRNRCHQPSRIEARTVSLALGTPSRATTQRPRPPGRAANVTGLGIEHVHADRRREERDHGAAGGEIGSPTELDVVVREATKGAICHRAPG